MGKTLVLTEKPSVARDIARVLGCRQNGNGCIIGQKYIVTWALGHLVTLADPETYDKKYQTWRMEDLPMLPQKMQLTVIKQTSAQFKAVSALLHRQDVSELVIATDAGREGELVARWILMKAGWKGVTKRLWISSQTDASIRQGFAELKDASAYDNLFRSARARSEADWLVGLNVTRALTCKHNAQLAAGRVQTPTLALIVKREEEIAKFVPKKYYTVWADFGKFSAVWRDKSGSPRISDREKAQEICDAAQRVREASVLTVQKTYKHKAPPAAYDLTELQRDANRKFAYSAKQTLSLMQSLYETHKLLTYPRTDSRYITRDVAATLPERLRAISVGPYKTAAQQLLRKPLSTKYIVDDRKVTDHHAIIPTEQYVNLSALTHEERNIYDLVVRRFLAVLCEAYEYEEVKVTLRADKQLFYAQGTTTRSAGWRAMYDKVLEDEAPEEESRSQELPPLSQGMRLPFVKARLKEGMTKPPARYTEATLLTAMENPTGQVEDSALRSVLAQTSGLGTPATRADIIEKLFDSFCIERRGKEICPTGKGKQLIRIVPEDLKSAALTAKWEQQLQLIAKGQIREDAFIRDMRQYASHLVSAVIASNAVFAHDNVTGQKCPDCGKFLLDVQGKHGRMLVCPDRECGYRKSVTRVTNARCPNCHKKLELRGEGDKQTFTCVCGYREKMAEFEKRRSERGAGKRDVQNYLQNQKKETAGAGALADLLAKWQESGQ